MCRTMPAAMKCGRCGALCAQGSGVIRRWSMSRRLKLDHAPEPVLIEGDARVLALEAIRNEPQAAEDYVATISHLWRQAQGTFLEIGKLLIRAKDMLAHGEYTEAVEARLPFSGRTAYQLREAARWAMEMDRLQAISLTQLPGAYSTIYLLSTLDRASLERAKHDGLIRPDLRRAELVARRRKRMGEPVRTRADLEARREKLRRERERLGAELREIEEALAEAID